MRQRSQKQLYLRKQSDYTHTAKELVVITALLDSLPEYDELIGRVWKDLQSEEKCVSSRGRKGMTAEQVLKSFIIKHYKNCSYRELDELTKDSYCIGKFLNIDPHSKGFSYKTLQKNIKLLSEETADFVLEQIKCYAQSEGIEDGSKTRTDATAVETNIHHPTDWNLLFDCIRVFTRLMTYLVEDHEIAIEFHNHFRAAKSRLFEINNSRKKKKEKKIKDMISLAQSTLTYVRNASKILANTTYTGNNPVGYQSLKSKFDSLLPHAETILDVAERRNLKGEEVPACDKLFSLFEEHTDIIAKGARDVTFGHKITLTTGSSSLILDVIIHEGNPADSTLVEDVLQRHLEFYGPTPPHTMTYDGCYYSQDNKKHLLDKKVKTAMFSKEPKKDCIEEPATRKECYNFRAGIEATVSMLKRMFGLKRIFEKGKQSFSKAVKGGVIAYNLFILARRKLDSA